MNRRIILIRILAVLAVVGLAALLAFFFRYDVRTLDDKGFVILRHDRWTGEVERCTNIRHALKSMVGCTSFHRDSDESWIANMVDALIFWRKKEEPAPPPPPPALAAH